MWTDIKDIIIAYFVIVVEYIRRKLNGLEDIDDHN